MTKLQHKQVTNLQYAKVIRNMCTLCAHTRTH